MHRVSPDMTTAMIIFTFMFICLTVVIVFALGLFCWGLIEPIIHKHRIHKCRRRK